jgi:phosphate acyltransferase
MLTIAVDAMGGDHAPKAEVEGAIRAARDLGSESRSGGPGGCGPRELEVQNGHHNLPIEVVHASERVTMEDSAAKAFRTKRDSSIRVASRMVRDGLAQGLVSAGNTGAVMATAKMVQGVVPGVERPAIVAVLPTAIEGKPWCWWMWAPTSIARRACWASSR